MQAFARLRSISLVKPNALRFAFLQSEHDAVFSRVMSIIVGTPAHAASSMMRSKTSAFIDDAANVQP